MTRLCHCEVSGNRQVTLRGRCRGKITKHAISRLCKLYSMRNNLKKHALGNRGKFTAEQSQTLADIRRGMQRQQLSYGRGICETCLLLCESVN
jgi:hypothetical protein